MNEIWKDVEGFEDYLMVSNMGNVLRKARTIETSKYTRFQKESLASQSDDKDGYKLLSLTINNNHHTLKIHRLVAKAFCDGFDEIRNEVNHIDGNKANNVFSNLEWSSRKENMNHAFENNLITIKDITVYDYICKNCNKDFSSSDKDRFYCSHKCAEISNRVAERPSKDELLILIKTKPFTSIGKMFNVSDNAIRKWCK